MHDVPERANAGAGDAAEPLDIAEATDMSMLDPTTDAPRLSRAVLSIMQASRPELARRRATARWARQVIAWRRPVLTTCTLAAAASLALIAYPSPSVGVARDAASGAGDVARGTQASARASASANQGGATASIAEAMGVPPAIALAMAGNGDTQQLILSASPSR